MKKFAIILIVLVITAAGFLVISNRLSRPANSVSASDAASGTMVTNGGVTWKLGAFSLNGTNVPMSNVTLRAIGELPPDTNTKR